jgi:hypothetical protein
MSTTLPTILASPRWSVVIPAGIRALLPALMAGLPVRGSRVRVGPPWAAVVLQGGEFGVGDAHLISVYAVGEAAACADEVVFGAGAEIFAGDVGEEGGKT